MEANHTAEIFLSTWDIKSAAFSGTHANGNIPGINIS